MASTRNKNTPGNYCLDQRQNVGIESWQLYTNGANGLAYDTRLPGNGLPDPSALANVVDIKGNVGLYTNGSDTIDPNTFFKTYESYALPKTAGLK